MLKIMRSAATALLAVASLVTEAQTLPAPPLSMPENTFTGKAVFDRGRDSIKSALCPQDQRIFDAITYHFPSDANVERVRAGRDAQGKRAIEISTGYMNFSAMIVQSVVYESLNKDEIPVEKRWTDYLSYLANAINNNAQAIAPNAVAASVLPYHTWAGIPEQEFAAFLNEHQPGLRSLMLDVFVFALLHEVGHHVLDHPPTGAIALERSRANEWEADMYAIAGLARLRLSTLGVLPYFIFSSEMEGEVDELSGSHDPAVCRGFYILSAGSEGTIAEFRRDAASACGKRIKDTDAAYASVDRSVCYRPTALRATKED